MPPITMRQLLEAGIHFGHQTRRWNPKMAPYIFGQRNGVYIIDLQRTMRQLLRAYACVRDTVAKGGAVLFVGTKRQAQEAIAREAQRCGMFYVNNRWLGGTLTNWETICKSIQRLLDLEELEESGKIEQYTKKEAIKLRKEREKLDANLCGIKKMGRVPQVMFVIDAKKEAIAVREAKRLEIESVGIVDTNCDPDAVSLPIPGNDDAIRAVNLFCKLMADAVMEGRMRAEKVRADEPAAPAPRKEPVASSKQVDEPVKPQPVADEAPAVEVTEAAVADSAAETDGTEQ